MHSGRRQFLQQLGRQAQVAATLSLGTCFVPQAAWALESRPGQEDDPRVFRAPSKARSAYSITDKDPPPEPAPATVATPEQSGQVWLPEQGSTSSFSVTPLPAANLWIRRAGLSGEYRGRWHDGKTIGIEDYRQLCWLLRDVQANQWAQIDPVLLQVLSAVQEWYAKNGFQRPIIITSGYRTAQTNNRLIVTEGAAKNSQHLLGKAVDLHVPDVPAMHLGRVAAYFRAGGVGFYPDRGFVHLDTARVRYWRG